MWAFGSRPGRVSKAVTGDPVHSVPPARPPAPPRRPPFSAGLRLLSILVREQTSTTKKEARMKPCTVTDHAQDDQSPKQDIYARITAKLRGRPRRRRAAVSGPGTPNTPPGALRGRCVTTASPTPASTFCRYGRRPACRASPHRLPTVAYAGGNAPRLERYRGGSPHLGASTQGDKEGVTRPSTRASTGGSILAELANRASSSRRAGTLRCAREPEPDPSPIPRPNHTSPGISWPGSAAPRRRAPGEEIRRIGSR